LFYLFVFFLQAFHAVSLTSHHSHFLISTNVFDIYMVLMHSW